MYYIDFFEVLGFDFKENLKPQKLTIEQDTKLSKKLVNAVFLYKNPINTNTSFYLIATTLEDNEIEIIRKFIWNENKVDLLFYYPENKGNLEMLYAKYSPKTTYKESILATFSTTKIDDDKIEKIKYWQFDSGTFWLNYLSYIDKSKYKGIDKELVTTLETLKKELNQYLQTLIFSEKERGEVVQALIDRTLYIKYLEDKHIINSDFYFHYFKDKSLSYKTLLERNHSGDINQLFSIIHEIFNNALFDQPTIDDKFLTAEICTLIATSFKADLQTKQLRLYDFQFDVLPVEFISYIYEIFLSDKQKGNGIYYTPKKLAQLIVDEVINEDRIGRILDPSCGSGMFLIVGYQRLLEIAQKQGIEPHNDIGKIKFRSELLAKNIFGIEKEVTAQRFTLFSLSLQIFTGINPADIREFIANELRENKKIDLFSEFSFFKNIRRANSLSIAQMALEGEQFDYLLGNPPFFPIPDTTDYKDEIAFLNTYKVSLSNEKKVLAQIIVGNAQISQCFFLKMKDWSCEHTRFGFVSNSSNFYNDESDKFQAYFYKHYGIEKIYELSKVKKMLFENAEEPVVALIFNNSHKREKIKYYPVDLGLFSEKPFELLIIQEDRAIEIEQEKLIQNELNLRDFLVGNEYDLILYTKLKTLKTLSELVLGEPNKKFIHEGLKIVGEKAICNEYKINKNDWKQLKRNEQLLYYENFRTENSSEQKNSEFLIPLLKPTNIHHFTYSGAKTYLRNDISNFERGRSPEIFIGSKIIFNRTGSKIKSIYSNQKIYFDFDLHILKLKNHDLYHVVNAILNSKLINYYIDLFLRKRVGASYPKIGHDAILNLPTPPELDEELVAEISEISQQLTEGKYTYSEKEAELNELIFDLYELGYWEKQRIRDYFLKNTKIEHIQDTRLKKYQSTIEKKLNVYLKTPCHIKISSPGFHLIVAKISLNGVGTDSPNADKAQKYLLNEIFEQNPNNNFLASQEKIFGKDCVYIIKEGNSKNWTETKAYEDGQDILKQLMQ